MRCRHRGSWLLCGARWEWCYQCGALRRMAHVTANHVEPETFWQRPVGEAENPYPLKPPRKRA